MCIRDRDGMSQFLSNYIRIGVHCDKLYLIGEIIVPRSIRSKSESKLIELHGFPDASEKGYGCCIYIRVIYQDLLASCPLLCSKSRVAPLRQVSLPRNELCACLLLSRLLFKVTSALLSFVNNVHLYSDSMVSLYCCLLYTSPPLSAHL